jgi:AraC family transcriptional regulator, transcriptional activator of pobA
LYYICSNQKNLRLHPHQDIERSFYHFSYLRDSKVHGIYFNSLTRYLSIYPFIKKNHSHDFYSILLFTQGSGTIRINNDEYKVHPKTICLIAPNQVHSFEGLEDAEAIIFFFCQDFYVEEFSYIRLLNVYSYTSRIDQNNCSPCIPLSENEYTPVLSTINSIHHEYEASTAANNSAIIIRSFLNIILLKLSSLYEVKSGKSGLKSKSDSILIHTLAQLIDSHFISEQQLAFYTTAFNISKRQLNEICNKHFNCGLKKILQERLMQEARKLLLSSELSVSEIAYKLNFEDNSYFNKVFKSNVGLTPRRFREMHKRLLP